jgi:hypothetical protein
MAVAIFFLISGFAVLVSTIYLAVVFRHYYLESKRKKASSQADAT